MQEDAYQILEFLRPLERRILRRGRVYYQNGLVEYVKKSHNHYTAAVSGSHLYTVDIVFHEDGSLQTWKCTCPYHWGDVCKHTVAVLLAIQAGEYQSVTPISKVQFTKDELTEAKRQIDSILHKLQETLLTLAAKESPDRYRSQITLAERRIHALEIANYYINQALSEKIEEIH